VADKVTERLNIAKAEIKQAKIDARGPKNDAAIQSLARAADSLEQVARVIVRILQGDEAEAKEITEDGSDVHDK
jgi:hypothetical protein